MKHAARALLIVSLAASSILTSGCFPLAATGVVMGAMALTDRRTVGAQAEDQGIELKASAQLRGESTMYARSTMSFRSLASRASQPRRPTPPPRRRSSSPLPKTKKSLRAASRSSPNLVRFS